MNLKSNSKHLLDGCPLFPFLTKPLIYMKLLDTSFWGLRL